MEIGDWLKSYDIILARNHQSKDYTTTFIYSKLQNVPINFWLFCIVTQMTPMFQIFSLDFNWTNPL